MSQLLLFDDLVGELHQINRIMLKNAIRSMFDADDFRRLVKDAKQPYLTLQVAPDDRFAKGTVKEYPFPLNDRFSSRIACLRVLTGNGRQNAGMFDSIKTEEIFERMRSKWGLKRDTNIDEMIKIACRLHFLGAHTLTVSQGGPIAPDILTPKQEQLRLAADALIGMNQLL